MPEVQVQRGVCLGGGGASDLLIQGREILEFAFRGSGADQVQTGADAHGCEAARQLLSLQVMLACRCNVFAQMRLVAKCQLGGCVRVDINSCTLGVLGETRRSKYTRGCASEKGN